MIYTNFDTRTFGDIIDGAYREMPFKEAIAQGYTTQEYLDQQERQMVEMVIRDLLDAGYADVTEEANKQNGTQHLYVFANAKGVHYCDTYDDVFDLEEFAL